MKKEGEAERMNLRTTERNMKKRSTANRNQERATELTTETKTERKNERT